MKLPYLVGCNIQGDRYYDDVWSLPHLIIGGASNTGKSVALRSLVVSTAYYRAPKDLTFFLFDIGAGSLSVFKNLPHLAYPIIKDAAKGVQIILWLEGLLNTRIADGEDAINTFPAVVCVIDEFVSFIRAITDKDLSKRLTDAIANLLQRGKHANIHMILATQDPTKASTHIDFGSVEARMSFAYPRHQQSMAILGVTGADKLTGKGSMLFKPPGCSEPIYLQGAYISTEDAERVVNRISIRHRNCIRPEVPDEDLPNLSCDGGIFSSDRQPHRQEQRNKELCRIILWALGEDNVSALKIMKTFRMSNRANEILDTLVVLGIVADKFANQPREVIPQCMGDLSRETMEFLTRNGIPEYEIEKAIQGQSDSIYRRS